MLIKVQKWGNSLALRIPKAFASQLHIEPGSEVDLSLEKGSLVIAPKESDTKPAPPSDKALGREQPLTKLQFSWDELISKVSEASLQYEIDNDGARSGSAPASNPVGKEPWPISNLQMEILKLYSTNLNGNELQELKTLLAGYFAKKAMEEADNIWEQQDLSNEEMDQWLNGKS
ncbi:MAG TPA: AbrB/MazE/SpoVT family DNA-binding domain-containing protein [Bacillota bacterium]|nr:AbrB/MazE/SpoVT family DNA-binding domain-containing protein [Bacillota bacterium]